MHETDVWLSFIDGLTTLSIIFSFFTRIFFALRWTRLIDLKTKAFLFLQLRGGFYCVKVSEPGPSAWFARTLKRLPELFFAMR
jgi:hypothetical protein